MPQEHTELHLLYQSSQISRVHLGWLSNGILSFVYFNDLCVVVGEPSGYEISASIFCTRGFEDPKLTI